MAMEVQVRIEKGIGILATDGYIDTDGGEKILAECKKLIEEGVSRIIAKDLCGTTCWRGPLPAFN